MTRCGGITGFLRVGSPLPGAVHAALGPLRSVAAHCTPRCALPNMRHLEYFHDHDRIEHMLFDGAPVPRGGKLGPDLCRPGLGIEFKRQDAQCYSQLMPVPSWQEQPR